MSAEKVDDVIQHAQSSDVSVNSGKVDLENDGEVFKRGEGIEDFRTVGWIHTTVILLKRKWQSYLNLMSTLGLLTEEACSHFRDRSLNDSICHVHPRCTPRRY